MLTDVNELLQPIGIPVTETCFKKPPSLPYIVFTESREVNGADLKNMLADRDITIELYTAKADRKLESAVEDVLNNIPIGFIKGERAWLDQDKFYMTTYDFNLLERI